VSTLLAGHWLGERVATDILVLASKGRAFRSLDTLITQQGGQHVLYHPVIVAPAPACRPASSRKPGQPAQPMSVLRWGRVEPAGEDHRAAGQPRRLAQRRLVDRIVAVVGNLVCGPLGGTGAAAATVGSVLTGGDRKSVRTANRPSSSDVDAVGSMDASLGPLCQGRSPTALSRSIPFRRPTSSSIPRVTPDHPADSTHPPADRHGRCVPLRGVSHTAT